MRENLFTQSEQLDFAVAGGAEQDYHALLQGESDVHGETVPGEHHRAVLAQPGKLAQTVVTAGVKTKLLGIATLLVTMYAMRKEGEQEVLHLCCKHKADVAICPRCGALSETIHDEQPRCVRHLDVWGKRTFLHFLSRRFDCEQCRRSFTEELAFVDTNRRQTRAFEQEIYKSCIGSNKKKVAKDKDLSQSSVRDIFNRWQDSNKDPWAQGN